MILEILLSRRLIFLTFYLSDSKYKNKFEKIRKDEKVVLDLKKNIDVFLNEIKTGM